jgi:hypothetical protein
MMKRCSWVRLIVRGWGAIAGLSASCARDTCCDGGRAAPMENATTIRGTLERDIRDTIRYLPNAGTEILPVPTGQVPACA